jgi:hypothetical protein
MNHQAILKRAWHILINYKTLWVFGFILALTTASMSGRGGGGSSSSHGNGNNFNFNFGQTTRIMPQLSEIGKDVNGVWNNLSAEFTRATGANLTLVIVIAVLVLLLLAVVFTIGNLVSEVAMIKMVDGYENTGAKITWKQGFRLGWSRSAWRLFLIKLVVGLVVLFGIALALGCVGVPFFLGGASNNHPNVGMIIAGVGLFFLFLFAAIILALTLSLVLEPVYRACVLEDLGVFESIKRGWKLVRANFKDTFLMWIILLGIQIGFLVVIIPVALIAAGVGLAIGGGSGVAIYLLGATAMAKNAAMIPAAIVGVLFFLLILIIPLTFVEGLKETYLSSAWTLTYRELRLPAVPVLPSENPPAENQPG